MLILADVCDISGLINNNENYQTVLQKQYYCQTHLCHPESAQGLSRSRLFVGSYPR